MFSIWSCSVSFQLSHFSVYMLSFCVQQTEAHGFPRTDCSWLQNRGGSLPDGKCHCVQVTGVYFALIICAGLTATPI